MNRRNVRLSSLAAAAVVLLLSTVACATNRDQFLRHLEGLGFGEDPRHGYVASQTLFHPEADELASADVKVNGLTARRVLCDLATDQGVMRVLGYFVQKAGIEYSFIEYTAQARFDGYLARADVKPERLTIRAAPRQVSLRQALQNFGVQRDRLEEHAILNGMGLDDTVRANTLLKVVK